MIYVCPHCQHSIGAIGDTCSGCGYVFNPSQWPEEAYSFKGMHPRLRMIWGENDSYVPILNEFFIGRSPGSNGLAISGVGVSGIHAKVFLSSGEWVIQNLGHEVLVNNISIEETRLKSGDVIVIGAFQLVVVISYKQDRVLPQYNGILCSADKETLANVERVYIGSDPKICQIIIKGADLRHALMYYHESEQAWYIVDCASSSGVKVNNDRIRNKKIYPGDEISIAGIDFLFNGDNLAVGQRNNDVLTLSFVDACAEGRNHFKILQDLNFKISSGEFVGVLGPSGCGKSSLIQRIVGISKFTSGDMLINGKKFATLPDEYLDAFSYQPQQNVLHSDLTLKEEFSCYRSLHARQNNTITTDDSRKVLRLVGLENELGKKISQLSGGQQRRAGIALALLKNPHMLVLDEPTSGLDPATETEIMTYLKRISNQNKTVICSTHIMANLNLFDKVLVLSRGHLVFWGTPSELKSYFKINHPFKLYRIFASGDYEDQIRKATEFSAQYYDSVISKKYNKNLLETKDMPVGHKVVPLKQVYGYWKRMFFELISFKNGGSVIKNFWSSSFFIQFLLQPLLVALVLKLACADKLLYDDGRKEVLFFAAVAVFWLGINNSVRELVKERTPWRCLEKLERVSTSVYLFSKIAWTTLFCLIQTFVFSFLLFYAMPDFSVANPPTDNPASIPFYGEIFWVLFIVCAVGAWIGLSISAIFKKENAAVSLLPIVLIPVLFFSQPIIRNSNYSDISKKGDGHYSPVAVAIENVMPCNAPEVLMDALNQKRHGDCVITDQQLHKNWFTMFCKTGYYFIASLLLIIFFQIKNENDWEGR